MFEMIISGYRWIFLQMSSVLGYGWAIVALSFICSALMAPLMKAVGGIVKRETDYQSVINPQLEAIKANYASDMERHLHIQRLYSRYSYSPLSAVKKVLPLFVQIPFLLLTYCMLSGTMELNGGKFLFLSNLGRPDALIPILHANLLPIVMTIVNIVTIFSTPNFTKKDRAQAIGIAILFLILLYTASSALLLYWTLNNVITMIRTCCVNKYEGAKVLLLRLKEATSLPKYLAMFVFNDKRLPFFVFSAILFSLYMFEVAYFLGKIRFDFGETAHTNATRLMVLALCIGSFLSIVLLRKERRLIRFLSGLNVLITVGYLLVISFYKFFPSNLADWFSKYPDRCLGYAVLLADFAIPYIIISIREKLSLRQIFISALSTLWSFVLIIFALTMHYSSSSENFILPAIYMFRLYACLLVPCLAICFIFAVLFGKWINALTSMNIIAIAIVGVYLVPMISFETGPFGYTFNLGVRVLFIVMLIALALFAQRKKLFNVFAVIIAIALMINSVLNFCSNKNSSDTNNARSLADALGKVSLVKSNNVYFLVYDSYVHRTVLDYFQLSDSKLYDELEKNGFVIYDSYSKGAHTLQSMCGMFTVNGIMGSSVRSTITGDNVYCDVLKENGYKNFFITSGYLLPNQNERMPGDYYFPDLSKSFGPDGILWSCIMRGYMSQSSSLFDDYTHEEWVNKKRDVIARNGSNNNFMYAHSTLPGHAVMNPKYRKGDNVEISLFNDRLRKAAAEMREDVKALLGRKDDSIIILAADHGSMLISPDKIGEYNAMHLLDRHGVFLAIRWPRDYKPCLKLNCLQNLMLEVLIYLSGDTSLARYQYDGTTDPAVAIGSPAGSIVDGIIQTGEDAGEGLFDAAKEHLKR